MVDSWVLRQQGLNFVLLEIQFALFRTDLDVLKTLVLSWRVFGIVWVGGEGGFKAGSDDTD